MLPELWGGLAGMLVALPSAIAFGVAIYAPLGAAYTGQGALAGIIGAVALGLSAPVFGGNEPIITAPSGPSAAIMSALAAELVHPAIGQGLPPGRVLLLLSATAVLCGALQALYAVLGGGRLIKYIPYPVASGYLSGVAILIFLGELPKALGLPKGMSLWHGLAAPGAWEGPAIAVAIVTVAVMLLAPKVTRAVPPAILGLLAGVSAYFALGFFRRELLSLTGNRLLVGPLPLEGGSLGRSVGELWAGLRSFKPGDLSLIVGPALTLSLILSIDTLKTCVALDSITERRHDSRRSLLGQGGANAISGLLGGVPGSATIGATLINASAGARTRVSGLVAGGLTLVTALLFARLVAWVPVAAFSGVLVVVASRMIDRSSIYLLRQRSTVLDFFVVATVVVTAVNVSLIAAAAAGVGLAILLFLRDQIQGTVIRWKSYGDRFFSKQQRLKDDMRILEENGGAIVACELQGNLFFGNTDQLLTELEEDIKTRTYVILDFRRIQSMDITAARMIEQIALRLRSRGGFLAISDLPPTLPSGQDLDRYFGEVGLKRASRALRIFPELDAALEWAENRVLDSVRPPRPIAEAPLHLREMGLVKGHKEETILAFESFVERSSWKAGETIFLRGESDPKLYLVRRGLVRIFLNVAGKRARHIATFSRGDFFGEIAFLDRGVRTADAVATTDVDLYVLSREKFDALTNEHHKLGEQLMEGIASQLALRLRRADAELEMLEES